MSEIRRSSEAFKYFEEHHWEYFLELESEFISTKKYVDFRPGNYRTYSVEYLKLFQAVCSEIEVVGKVMAAYGNPDFLPTDKDITLYKWWYEVQDSYYLSEGMFTPMNPCVEPAIFKMKEYKTLLLDRLWFKPWEFFSVEKRGKDYKLADKAKEPKWWSEYNGVKHNRLLFNKEDSKYHLANLKNVMLAFSALYVLEKAFMDSVGEAKDLQAFSDFSRLFVKRRVLTHDELDMMFEAGFRTESNDFASLTKAEYKVPETSKPITRGEG